MRVCNLLASGFTGASTTRIVRAAPVLLRCLAREKDYRWRKRLL